MFNFTKISCNIFCSYDLLLDNTVSKVTKAIFQSLGFFVIPSFLYNVQIFDILIRNVLFQIFEGHEKMPNALKSSLNHPCCIIVSEIPSSMLSMIIDNFIEIITESSMILSILDGGDALYEMFVIAEYYFILTECLREPKCSKHHFCGVMG